MGRQCSGVLPQAGDDTADRRAHPSLATPASTTARCACPAGRVPPGLTASIGHNDRVAEQEGSGSTSGNTSGSTSASARKRAGSRKGEKAPGRARGRVLAYAVGITLAVVAWGYLVWAAIDFGSSARDGDNASWWFLALAALGAVACLFVGLMLLARLVRTLGMTPSPAEPPRAGGKRAAR